MFSSLPEWLEMITVTLGAILFLLVGILFLGAPLTIQWIVYPIAKLCMKKVPPCIIYLSSLSVNTLLLYGIKEWLSSFDEGKLAGLEILILMIIWLPSYIGVLISCIIRIIKAVKTARSNSGGLD